MAAKTVARMQEVVRMTMDLLSTSIDVGGALSLDSNVIDHKV